MNDNEGERGWADLGCFEHMAVEELDRRLLATLDVAVKALPSLNVGHAGGVWGRSLVQVYREVIRLTQDAIASSSIELKRSNATECQAIAVALVAADESHALRYRAAKFASRRQLQLTECPPRPRAELADIITLRPVTTSGNS